MALTLLPFCVIVAVLFPPAYSFPLQGSISHSQTLLPLLLLFLHREPLEEISWPSRLPPGQVCSLLQFCHLPAYWCSSSPSAEHCAYTHLHLAFWRHSLNLPFVINPPFVSFYSSFCLGSRCASRGGMVKYKVSILLSYLACLLSLPGTDADAFLILVCSSLSFYLLQ